MDLLECKKKLENKANNSEHEVLYKESIIIKFEGVEGFDVYNCSVPFFWKGKKYIFGRVERFQEWMRSWVCLFEETKKDIYRRAEQSMLYQLEDPYVSFIKGELVFGGTHVRISSGKLDTFYGYFYRGTDIDDLYYFTTGPDHMKDIRLVELSDGRIGVFSRPRGEDLIEKYGMDTIIGFTIIDSLDDLTGNAVKNAAPIPGLLEEGQWGGCNQAYLLSSGKVGVLGHLCCNYIDDNGVNQSCYTAISFVLEPETREIFNYQLIGSRKMFPAYQSKRDYLSDCIFPSGIVMRKDGGADLYCGLSDCAEGRVVVEYPFEGFGEIVQY